MRSAILVGLLVFVIVCGSVLGFSWYTQSVQIKQDLEQAIANLNKNGSVLSYESIEVSGFPIEIEASIVNPRFSGRIDEIVRALEKQSGASYYTALPEWQEDITLDGQVIFTVNMWSDHYSMIINGDWKSAGTIAGKPVSHMSSSGVETICSVELAQGSFFGTLWNMNLFERKTEEFLEALRLFDCGNTGGETIDQKTNKALMRSGPARLYVRHQPDESQRHVRIYLKISDSEITAEGDKMLAAYMALMPDYPFPTLFSIYGKQNIEVNFSYDGPASLNSASAAMPMDINLGTYEITNDLYNSKGHFHLSNKSVNPNMYNSAVDMHFESNYSEAYDLMLRDTIRNFLQHAASSNDPELRHIQTALNERTPQENYNIIEPIIPNLHAQGTWIQSLNLSYAGNNTFTGGNLNLKNLAFSTSLYGLSGNGTVKTTKEKPLPTANFKFLCTNCMQMVDDLVDYAGRAQTVIGKFQPDTPQSVTFTPRVAKGIKKFLSLLSRPANPNEPNNLVFIIATNNQGSVTIGGRNIMHVLTMYKEYIGRELENRPKAAYPHGWKVE